MIKTTACFAQSAYWLTYDDSKWKCLQTTCKPALLKSMVFTGLDRFEHGCRSSLLDAVLCSFQAGDPFTGCDACAKCVTLALYANGHLPNAIVHLIRTKNHLGESRLMLQAIIHLADGHQSHISVNET